MKQSYYALLLEIFLFSLGIFMILNYGSFHWVSAVSPSIASPATEEYLNTVGQWSGVGLSASSFLVRYVVPKVKTGMKKIKHKMR